MCHIWYIFATDIYQIGIAQLYVDKSHLNVDVKHNVLRKDNEGLNYLYKTLSSATLSYARKYKSMPYKETNKLFKKSITIFEDYLIAFLSDKRCMSSNELAKKRLMKRKHYIYGAYLGVLSSFPILHGNIPPQDLLKAITAKIAEIVSIKTLDNVNDSLHTCKQAAKSLEIQHKAFTSDSFDLQERYDYIGRVENSTYQLANFTNQLVSRATNRTGPAFRLYLDDIDRYIKGQTSSMNQRLNSGDFIDFHTFLIKANEKAVGRIWAAVDFCFLNSLWYLDTEDLKTIAHVKKAVDLIFKGCNVYDDIADLEIDLQHRILNSVIFLALDNGLCEKHDLYEHPIKLKAKLEREGAIYSALELGNLIFSMGLEELKKAKSYASRIDIDGLEFSCYVLRLFALRKWLMKQYKSVQLFKTFSLDISDEIMEYAKYVQ